jgi:hypothetical protein
MALRTAIKSAASVVVDLVGETVVAGEPTPGPDTALAAP